MEFFSVGQKLKILRKQFRMKQEELSDENISRGYISMIEIGKRIPNKHDAKYILDKIKKRAKELNIEVPYDDMYFTRNEKEEAEFYCNEILSNDAKTLGEINKIIEISVTYDLPEVMATAYSQLGDIEFKAKDYNYAFMCYVKAFDLYKSLNISKGGPYLYNMMGRCKSAILQFEEALIYFNLSNFHALMGNEEEIRKRSLYNIGVCYKKLGKVEEAIKFIDNYIDICDREADFDVYVYANLLKATCYESKGLIDSAIDILTDQMKNFEEDNNSLLGYIYSNLGSCYLKKKLYDESLEYFYKSRAIRENLDKYNLSHTIIEMAFVYIDQQLYEEAILLLEQGIELSKNNNDIEYSLKAYRTLAEVYDCLKEYSEAENIYLKVVTLLKDNNCDRFKKDLATAYIKLSQLSLKQGNISELREKLDEIERII